MFICLSSGSRRQYRDDIFRTLALPPGALIQFRYDKQYLSDAVTANVNTQTYFGEEALIVFVDQFDSSKDPEFVPCRYATVQKIEEHGTTVSIELLVDDFALAEDLEAFSGWLRESLSPDIPISTASKIVGKYFLGTTKFPSGLKRTSQLCDWEKIVCQIALRQDFHDSNCFFALRELKQGSDLISASKGVFSLKSGRNCELRLYHYHPSTFTEKVSLKIAMTDGISVSMLSNPTIPIDSRYDQKYIRFHIAQSPTNQYGFLTISRESDQEIQWLFDLPIKIEGRFLLSLCYTIGVAILLAGPQIFAVWLNSSITAERAVSATVISVVCAILAGAFAVFGLKKAW